MDGDGTYSATHVEELLKCPICLDRFKHPKHLPCQHTICKAPCLVQLLANSRRLLHCPQCRKAHPVPPGGVDAFPDNIIINNLLDLRRVPTAQSFKCTSCERTENLSLCKHCNKQVCAGCQPQHLTSLRTDVQASVERLKSKIPHLAQKVSSCSQRQNGVKVCFQKIRHDVNHAIDSKIQALKERKQVLLTEIEVLEGSRLHELQQKQEKYELDTASAASFCDSAANDLHNIASPTSLLNVKKQCEDLLKGLETQERDQGQVDVRFEHDDGELGHSIGNYGRVVAGGGSNRPVAPPRRTPRVTLTSRSSAPVHSLSLNEPMLEDFFSHTFPSRLSPGSNSSSLFGPYPSNRRRTDSPPIPALAYSPRPEPSPRQPPQEAFSGFISLENPNFRPRRNRGGNNSTGRRQSHPRPEPRQRPWNSEPFQRPSNEVDGSARRRWNERLSRAPFPAPPIRQTTFTREEDDDDDDIVTTRNNRRAAISFDISLEDPPLPPRTPNSLEARRPVNNYQNKQPYKTIQERRGQSWFKNCTGVTVASDTDNLYIVDEQASKILIFDSNGRHIKSFGSQGSGQGQLSKPFDAAFRWDILYVSDAGNNRIQAFSTDGEMVSHQTSYQFQWPQGLASDGAQLYVCDSGHGRICVLGEAVTTFQHAQVPKPTHIAIGRQRVAITDPDIHAVFLFSMDGTMLRRFGQEGSAIGDILRPTGLAIDFQGFVLVANSSNYRTDVFRENGEFLCTFGNRGQGQGQLKKIQGLAVTSNGRVAICDGNKVEMF